MDRGKEKEDVAFWVASWNDEADVGGCEKLLYEKRDVSMPMPMLE